MQTPNQTPNARFSVGQMVHHIKFGYRGVIADVDPVFSASEEWYEQVARSRPPRDQPWYHVLVDGAEHTTYVAERHLELDASGKEIEHPLVGDLFEIFDGDRYRSRVGVN